LRSHLCFADVIARTTSLAVLVLTSTVIAAVFASVAGSTSEQDHLRVVVQRDQHAKRSRTLECAAAAGHRPLCTRTARLVLSYGLREPERCLQVWGGWARAQITGAVLDRTVKLRLSRANSCEIHKWDALAPLLSG
jgi:hypothetical protein